VQSVAGYALWRFFGPKASGFCGFCLAEKVRLAAGCLDLDGHDQASQCDPGPIDGLPVDNARMTAAFVTCPSLFVATACMKTVKRGDHDIVLAVPHIDKDGAGAIVAAVLRFTWHNLRLLVGFKAFELKKDAPSKLGARQIPSPPDPAGRVNSLRCNALSPLHC
jgi:hypothetical protein